MNQIKKEMMKIAEKLDPIDINHFIKCINNERLRTWNPLSIRSFTIRGLGK